MLLYRLKIDELWYEIFLNLNLSFRFSLLDNTLHKIIISSNLAGFKLVGNENDSLNID